MMRLHGFYKPVLGFALAWGAALASAQTITPGMSLPMRNVLIEVRQDDGQTSNQDRLEAQARVRTQPGRTEADVALNAQSQQSSRNSRAQQQVLVLNGQPTALRTGVTLPLRLRQTVTQGGIRRLVPGTVWLEAGSGLTATPVWDGGDMVYLALAAAQGPDPARARAELARGEISRAEVSTTLLLPLDEWVTIADTDETQDQQLNAYGIGAGQTQSSGTRRWRVQVRVSVPTSAGR
jgi:hypothetical protein